MNFPYDEAAHYILEKTKTAPSIGIVLGSGLGGFASALTNPITIPYTNIPGFVPSTAPDHAGQFVFGELEGKHVLCMQGRLHYYEGYSMQQITFPVRVMKLLGIQTLLLTNASGGINEAFSIGDFMLIDDHINFMGLNPLIGKNNDRFGSKFFDMTYAYTPALKEIALSTAATLNIPLKRGVYLGCPGPNFETPAEIKAFRVLGADAVGMSTVPEVLVASHCELPVLALSLIHI